MKYDQVGKKLFARAVQCSALRARVWIGRSNRRARFVIVLLLVWDRVCLVDCFWNCSPKWRLTIFGPFLTWPDISSIDILLAYQQSMYRCDRVGLARIDYNCCAGRFTNLFTCDLIVMDHNFWRDVALVLSHELSRHWRNIKFCRLQR